MWMQLSTLMTIQHTATPCIAGVSMCIAGVNKTCQKYQSRLVSSLYKHIKLEHIQLEHIQVEDI